VLWLFVDNARNIKPYEGMLVQEASGSTLCTPHQEDADEDGGGHENHENDF